MKGSHGRPTEDEDGPLLMSNAPRLLPDGPVAATAVKDIVLAHVFDVKALSHARTGRRRSTAHSRIQLLTRDSCASTHGSQREDRAWTIRQRWSRHDGASTATGAASLCPCCGARLALHATARRRARGGRGGTCLPPGTMIIDPHAHMISRTTDDYEAMARAGVVAVIEPAFWIGQPRTNLGSYVDYLSTIIGFEKFRAGQFGIRHYCCVGLNAKEANNEELAEAVMDVLPHFATKDGVVAIGEIGYDEQTPLEDKYLRAQIELAKELELPIMIHTPHRDKKRGTTRTMDVLAEHGFDPRRCVIDHNTEETVQRGARPRLLRRLLDLSADQDGQRADDRDRAPLRAGADHRRFRLRLGRVRSAGGAEDRRA